VTRFQLSDAHVTQVARETLPADLEAGSWPQDSALLRVELKVSRNLRSAAEKYELNVGNDVFACSDRQREYSSMPYVYDAKGRVDAYHGAGDDSRTIWFYLAQRSDRRKNTDNEVVPAYDLTIAPAEICVELTGGAMYGKVIRSNTLRFNVQRENRDERRRRAPVRALRAGIKMRACLSARVS